MKSGILAKSGAWFSYNGEKIGQGKVNAVKYLTEHKDVAAEIEKKIRDFYSQASDYSSTLDFGGDDADKAEGNTSLNGMLEDYQPVEIPDDL